MVINNLTILENYRRLKHIRRCNNFPTIQTEDVAQHSFYTAILAMTLADEYNKFVDEHNSYYHPYDYENILDNVDVHKVLIKALFHDMEEAFTSDIPYNIKHHSITLNSAMKDCISEVLDKVYKDSDFPVTNHKSHILNCKKGVEGRIVALADLLEGAWYCYQELSMGNNYIRGLFKNYIIEIEKLDFSPVIEHIIPTLKEVCPTFKSMLHMFKNSLVQIEPIKSTTLIV